MHRGTRLLACLSLCLALASGSTVAAQPLFTVPRIARIAPAESPTSASASSAPSSVAQRSTSVAVNDQTLQVVTTVTVANNSDAAVRKLQLTLPPTVLDGVDSQKVLDITFSQTPANTRQTPSGLEVTYQVAEVAPGEVLTFVQTYTVQLGESESAAIVDADPQSFLAAEAGIEVDAPAIQAKASELTAGIASSEAKATALLQFVSHHIRYDLKSTSRNKGALAGLQSGSGVCSEYASLFVALARASGIPARLVYGWASDTGLKSTLDGSQRHVWAQYYLPEHGWVSADPTFASVLPLEQATYFNPGVHLAQDWRQTAHAGSYAGRGILTITASYQVAKSDVVASH